MYTLKVTPDEGEPFEVYTTSRAVARWENAPGQKTPRSIGSLAKNVRMTDIVDLAWFAADLKGLTTLDIRQWRDGVDIAMVRKDDDEDDDEGEDAPYPPAV